MDMYCTLVFVAGFLSLLTFYMLHAFRWQEQLVVAAAFGALAWSSYGLRSRVPAGTARRCGRWIARIRQVGDGPGRLARDGVHQHPVDGALGSALRSDDLPADRALVPNGNGSLGSRHAIVSHGTDRGPLMTVRQDDDTFAAALFGGRRFWATPTRSREATQ